MLERLEDDGEEEGSAMELEELVEQTYQNSLQMSSPHRGIPSATQSE
jgi:hypothetical protein